MFINLYNSLVVISNNFPHIFSWKFPQFNQTYPLTSRLPNWTIQMESIRIKSNKHPRPNIKINNNSYLVFNSSQCAYIDAVTSLELVTDTGIIDIVKEHCLGADTFIVKNKGVKSVFVNYGADWEKVDLTFRDKPWKLAGTRVYWSTPEDINTKLLSVFPKTCNVYLINDLDWLVNWCENEEDIWNNTIVHLKIKNCDTEKLSKIDEETRKSLVTKILNLKSLKSLVCYKDKETPILSFPSLDLFQPNDVQLLKSSLNSLIMQLHPPAAPHSLKSMWYPDLV